MTTAQSLKPIGIIIFYDPTVYFGFDFLAMCGPIIVNVIECEHIHVVDDTPQPTTV
jgi:hypothetical protein